MNWKQDSYVAKNRADIARMYRTVRAESRPMARLIRRRYLDAERRLMDNLFVNEAPNQTGGIAALVRGL